MEKHPTDPVVSAVRAARNAQAARFDDDVDAIFLDIRAMQGKSGREDIRLPARPAVASDASSASHARNA